MKDDIPLLELDLSIEGIAYNSIPNSRFLTAIRSVSKEITGKDIKVINKGDLKIVVEKHQEISAFYITFSDCIELRTKIHSLLKLFRSRFGNFIIQKSVDISLFEDFKEVILNFLSDEVVKDYYIIKTLDQTPKDSIHGDYWPLISKINDNRTIKEIANKLKSDLKTVKKGIVFLKSKDLISFSIRINPYDIPYLVPKSISRLFNTNENFIDTISRLGKNRFKIIKSIDAKSSIIKLAERNSTDLSEIIEILKLLLIRGYIEILSEKLKWCIIYEDFYKLFSKLIKKFLGDVGLKIFKKILEEEKSPLIRLIKYPDHYKLSFEAVKLHIETQKKINIENLHFIFSSTILRTIEIIKPALDLLCSNYIIEFKNGLLKIIEKLEKTYGLKNIQKLKKYLNLKESII